MESQILPEKTTRVSIGTEKYKTLIEAEGHKLVADEPVAVGGTGQGLNPFSLLLASLGSCGAITGRMYADRKHWPLDKIEIELQILHRNQKGQEEDLIIKKVRLYGPLSPYQKKRIIEIIDKCPVQKAIGDSLLIQSELMPV